VAIFPCLRVIAEIATSPALNYVRTQIVSKLELFWIVCLDTEPGSARMEEI